MKLCRETLANIIDVFEDFLESKGVKIDNPDRPGNDGEAIIYGEDFDDIMNGISDVLKASGIFIADIYDGPHKEQNNVLKIYVPSKQHIIEITAGTGDNLLKEDIAEGYVDYLNYNIFDATREAYEYTDPEDGGMFLTKEYIETAYNSLVDTVPDILEMAYDDINDADEITWVVLSGDLDFKRSFEANITGSAYI